MRATILGLPLLLMMFACGSENTTEPFAEITDARTVPVGYTQTFTVYERDAYRIVDIEASVVRWGGAAGGPAQRARLVLVPREVEAPALTGDLSGATLIRTPVMRIAVNDQPFEAMARALGIADRLVAVGGHNSYDDNIRQRVQNREILQVGYGWHQPPSLDSLLASRPDVFLARMADLTHTQHMDRIQSLGVPVLPVFMDSEPHYMGRVDWVLLLGMITGREQEAEAFVRDVAQEVDRLKQLAAEQPRRSVLWAWYQSSGNRWAVTQRNSSAELIRDANADVVLGAPNNPELDNFSRLSTEQLLQSATDADCWVIRDPLSAVFTDRAVLERFKAYQEDCVFWEHGGPHPTIDSHEIWEMATIRPDWLLSDIIRMVHTPLRDGNWRLLAPETWEVSSGGSGAH